MSDDLIRRSDVLETYADLYDIFDDNKAIQEELHKVFDKINDISAVEPKRGEWIEINIKDYKAKCSCCGTWSPIMGRYCPNCGADMRKESER